MTVAPKKADCVVLLDAEGSGATSEDRGKVARTRGLHKDAALAS